MPKILICEHLDEFISNLDRTGRVVCKNERIYRKQNQLTYGVNRLKINMHIYNPLESNVMYLMTFKNLILWLLKLFIVLLKSCYY